MEGGEGYGHIRLDENGNPNYRFNPLLADLSAHTRMMDKAGIDVAVLSCGSGFDQPDVATWRSRPTVRSISVASSDSIPPCRRATSN
jgi:hypothetical protein